MLGIKKTELYDSLQASCDDLRGGKDASQYKDFVLAMLFVNYISDKYAGENYAPLMIPEGARSKTCWYQREKKLLVMVSKKKIFNPLNEVNQLQNFADFNDPTKFRKWQGND